MAKPLPVRDLLLKLVNDIVELSDPAPYIAKCLRKNGDYIYVCGRRFRAGSVAVVAIGKASSKAIEPAVNLIKPTYSLAIIPKGWLRPRGVDFIESTHPLPSYESIRAAEAVLRLAEFMKQGDLAIFIISGGGSALVELPQQPISIEDLVELNKLMLMSGLSIREMNIVRKHVSLIKGGFMAKAFIDRGVRVVGLYISDVPGDDPSIIASGPTVPDPSTFIDAERILELRGLWDKIPQSVRGVIETGVRGLIQDTPKSLPVYNKVILTNMDVLRGLKARLAKMGYRSVILTSRLEGESREVGKAIASIALESCDRGLPIKRGFLLMGGEPTVTVRGSGRGGRTMELAASFAESVNDQCNVALLALATDGIDGNTDAAGAYADSTTAQRAIERGLIIRDYLNSNNTYELFNKLGDLIKTGPTGSQLNSVIVVSVNV